MTELPDTLLDRIAETPDDVGVWQVFTDLLLEHDSPLAQQALAELQLLRGVSHPDLLQALVDGRRNRPRLPHEPGEGFDITWRCGLAVRATLDFALTTEQARDVLTAPALRALHQLSLRETSAKEGGLSMWSSLPALTTRSEPMAARLEALLPHVPAHLRRLSVDVRGRFGPVLPPHFVATLEALTAGLPSRVTRVDLALGPCPERALEALPALAARLTCLNLEGSELGHLDAGVLVPVLDAAPRCTLCVGGTGLSPRTPADARLHWLTPEATGWLEHEQTGAVVPIEANAAGFRAAVEPRFGHELRRDLGVWSEADGAVLVVRGQRYRFHDRAAPPTTQQPRTE